MQEWETLPPASGPGAPFATAGNRRSLSEGRCNGTLAPSLAVLLLGRLRGDDPRGQGRLLRFLPKRHPIYGLPTVVPPAVLSA